MTKPYLRCSVTLSRFSAKVELSHCRLSLFLSERVMQMRDVPRVCMEKCCQTVWSMSIRSRRWALLESSEYLNPRSKHIKSRKSFVMQLLRKEPSNTTKLKAQVFYSDYVSVTWVTDFVAFLNYKIIIPNALPKTCMIYCFCIVFN